MFIDLNCFLRSDVVHGPLVIPHATSCGGYNVFDPSVSQSISPVVSCQHNSSEAAQQNFVKLCSYEGHNVQMCISTWNFDSIFFSELNPFLLRNLAKMKDTTETVCQHMLNRISWYFVVVKGIPCRCAYLQEILIQFFFSLNYALFELRNLTKIKDNTHNSSSAQLQWNRSTEFCETL